MKRIALVSCALVLAAAATSAKAVAPHFGVIGGLNLANVSFDPDVDADKKARMAFHVGGYAEFPMSPMVSIAAGAEIDMKGTKLEGSSEVKGVDYDVTSTSKLSYLSIPAMVVAKFGSSNTRPFLMAGPQLSLLLSAKQKTEVEAEGFDSDSEEDIKDTLKSIGLDLSLGGGVQFKLGEKNTGILAAAYEFGLTDLDDEDDDFDVKNRTIKLSAGVGF